MDKLGPRFLDSKHRREHIHLNNGIRVGKKFHKHIAINIYIRKKERSQTAQTYTSKNWKRKN